MSWASGNVVWAAQGSAVVKGMCCVCVEFVFSGKEPHVCIYSKLQHTKLTPQRTAYS